MDPIKILKRAWHIVWNYRALWAFGLILALAAGGASSHGGGNNGVQYRDNGRGFETHVPHDVQQGLQQFGDEMNHVFERGLPGLDLSKPEIVTLLWVFGAFVLVMILTSLAVAVARYVSETAVIRMVDEYESTGSKMTVGEGFRIGWSRASWRLFLINLIVNLPGILFFALLLVIGVFVYLSIRSGSGPLTAVSIVSLAALFFLSIFVVFILSVALKLFRNFFWRVSVLENAGVRESLRRGFNLARENWKDVGLMWLVMIGLGIAWAIAFIIAVLVTIPVVIMTAIVGALVAAIPALLFVGVFSLFLAGPWPWIMGVLFALPLFFLIAFSPWLLIGSWRQVFISSVWTLVYREIKAPPVPATVPTPPAEPSQA